MGIISFVVTVASSLYQRQQAKKAKKKADKAADERKGFEVPVEGEIGNVPVITVISCMWIPLGIDSVTVSPRAL